MPFFDGQTKSYWKVAAQCWNTLSGRMSRWKGCVRSWPAHGQGLYPWKENPVGGVRQVRGQLGAGSFVRQLPEQRPGLANTTRKPEIPGADDAAGTQVKFTSGRVSQPKGVSGGQCSSDRDQALPGS